MLLEHLAAAARERGVRRFVAEVLPQNGRMIAVFKQAGYEVRQRTEDGIVAVGFDIDPTDRSLAVMADREHRAEALSMRGVLHASSVVVVGPGTEAGETLAGRLAARVLADLLVGDPSVVVHAVGVPGDPPLPVHARLADVPGPVELAVVAVPAAAATDVARDLARLDVHGIVLLTAGFAEDGPDGLDRQRAVLRAAHGAGMRVVGPSSYGIISTREGGLQLNASLAQSPPAPGRVGLFCQSAPLSVALLAAVRRRGIGVSQFVSAGHRADVSGNDLMQFWADDDSTDVVGLYLESLGNPRKFSRVARRLSLIKPVIVVTAGRSGQVVPPGHAVRPTHAPPRTLAEMLRQSGVVRVENTHQLLDVAQVLAHQPLPAGPPHRDPGQLRVRGGPRRRGGRGGRASWSAGTCSCWPRTPRRTGSVRPSTPSTTTPTATSWSWSASRPSAVPTPSCRTPSRSGPRAPGGRPWRASTTCTA